MKKLVYIIGFVIISTFIVTAIAFLLNKSWAMIIGLSGIAGLIVILLPLLVFFKKHEEKKFRQDKELIIKQNIEKQEELFKKQSQL